MWYVMTYILSAIFNLTTLHLWGRVLGKFPEDREICYGWRPWGGLKSWRHEVQASIHLEDVFENSQNLKHHRHPRFDVSIIGISHLERRLFDSFLRSSVCVIKFPQVVSVVLVSSEVTRHSGTDSAGFREPLGLSQDGSQTVDVLTWTKHGV